MLSKTILGVVLGAIMLGFGAFFGADEYRFGAAALQTSGTVTGHKCGRHCRAEVDYADDSGTQHFKNSETETLGFGHAVGTKVPVLYLPGNRRAEINDIWRWYPTVLFGGVGLLVVIGLALQYRGWLDAGRRRFELTKHGAKVRGHVLKEQRRRLKSSGWLIRLKVSVRVPMSGQQRELKGYWVRAKRTENIPKYPSEVDVYFDRNNDRRFWIDVSYLDSVLSERWPVPT